MTKDGALLLPHSFIPREPSFIETLDRQYGLYTDRYANGTAYYHSFGRELVGFKLNDGRLVVNPKYAYR